MAVKARGGAPEYGQGNFFYLSITGRSAEYRIDWGDGTSFPSGKNDDTDHDGKPDRVFLPHVYQRDGNYQITISPLQGPEKDVVMNVFARAHETGSLTLDGTTHADVMITGEGADRLSGGKGDDLLLGRGGDDDCSGGKGDDLLFGDVGDDRLSGGTGDDVLLGSAGDDILSGAAGNDVLINGDGLNRMTGGAGADVFSISRFEDGVTVDPDRDQITDFKSGEDKISFATWDYSFTFVGDAAFSGSRPEVRYEVVDGSMIVFGDYNADRVADLSIDLGANRTLVATDFVFA